jgi:hypothetical protein
MLNVVTQNMRKARLMAFYKTSCKEYMNLKGRKRQEARELHNEELLIICTIDSVLLGK